jgi:hypothetical protein
LVTTTGADQWALKQLNIGTKEQLQNVKDEISIMVFVFVFFHTFFVVNYLVIYY